MSLFKFGCLSCFNTFGQAGNIMVLPFHSLFVSLFHHKKFDFIIFRPHATVCPLEDPVVREVKFVLREWAIFWKRLYVVNITLFCSEDCLNCE